jgi:hypothetical protein
MNNGYIFTDGNKIGKCDYEWSDNSTMKYTSWDKGEPAQRSTENCMILWKKKWYDLPCTGYSAHFLCEYPDNVDLSSVKIRSKFCIECSNDNCKQDVSYE